MDHVESCPKAYFKCLGRQQNCSEKFFQPNKQSYMWLCVHYESAFTEVNELCKEVLATTQVTQKLDETQLQDIASIPDDILGF